MRIVRFLIQKGWLGVILILVMSLSTEAAEVPLEIYGHLPSLKHVAVSPDGTCIAFEKRQKPEDCAVYVYSILEKKWVASCNVGDNKLRKIMWADDDHLLFILTTTSRPPMGFSGPKAEWGMLLSFDLGTNEITNPVTVDASSKYSVLNVIIGWPSIRRIKGQTIVFVEGLYVAGHTMPALFELNLTKGRTKIVARGNDRSRGWLVDEDGVVTASQSYYDRTGQWKLEVRKNKRLSEAASGEADIEYPTLAGFSPEGDAVWVEAVEDDNPTWRSISLKTGTMGDPLPETKGFRKIETDPYTDRVVGGFPFGGDGDFVFFDPLRQVSWETLKNKFPGEYVDIVSTSRDFQRMVILVDGPVHGYKYYLIDLVTLQLSPIGDVYEGLTRIAEVRHIKYSAADGMMIPGYLTLPMDREAKKLPLVVMPHGGPAARDTGRFDWWAQAFASQGYAVLQPNYRGSRLDWEFMAAGFGEWGRKMQTDLSDGVRRLVKEGIVDADCVCIVGASYGGYAALAGVTLDTGVYRCAVSVGGLSDLSRYMKWIARRPSRSKGEEKRYWDRYFGVSEPTDSILKTLSPVEYAEKVCVPVMLIHGRDDTVVPFDQSKRMADALEDAKKSVELVVLDHEDHWLSRSDTRLQMLEATIRFLKKNNPPD